ncbi:hypothetical protein CYMTET_12670 [Cymbomonas tetramitiformis]|uniref:Uncharacterized protein n=1 Tax=Cymbomonas tetramitiformis TaxID=36881 RepID=A0AAE0LC77_9CHLO|nr:hypothetical protein CYMTET_12670 [Cymbomonas tetramitiformis]
MESDDSDDDELDVHEELRRLRSQIGKAVTFGQASVPPASSLSFAGISTEPQQQVVPRHGGAAGSDVPAGFIARVSVPTEEFPGGVDRVPTLAISAVNFSCRAEESFVGHKNESGPSQIDVMFMKSEEETESPLDLQAEEEEEPALNGDHAADYADSYYGMGVASPWHRPDTDNIADIFTQPLPPRASFFDNPSFYGIELYSEDSGFMVEVD